MSDSEDSTVTYTEIPSPYEDLSDIGSPGAEGPIFQDPPSPDYVPGPEEPEQAPPSPIYVPFVPEPVYPEFLPEDDVLPAEEQPLPIAASPTTESPGYIPESDPEEDPEEDDEEDPEEDPADYPADRGDDRDDEEPSDDDDDDDAEEEEHLAPADPAAVAYSADQDPYLAYRVTARMSIRPQGQAPIPSPPLPIPSQPPIALHMLRDDVIVNYIIAAVSRTRRQRLLAVGCDLKDSESSRIDDRASEQQDAKGSCRARVPEEAVAVLRRCYGCSYCQSVKIYGLSKNGTKRKAHKNHEGKASHRDSPTSHHNSPTSHNNSPRSQTSTPLPVTSAQLQAMIDEGVTAVLAARATTRNGDDSHTSGTGVRRNERTIRECTYQDFMKCQPLFFKGTEGVGTALTWWNSHARTVTNEVAYAMTWSDLKKKMTTKYCPRNEIKKIEVELWNLKVQGTDVVAYNQRFRICIAGVTGMYPERD
ncbi:putative reverse transcriptase domain-containing protein [Tanacetum coccineum]